MAAFSRKQSQMRSKLKNGLAALKRTSEGDRDGIAAALLKLHGAMEDYVRLEIAERVPDLREQVEDVSKSKWKDLLDHGRTYLGFTRSDCDMIDEANRQRNDYAHGGEHTYSYQSLESYARFVQRWIEGDGGPTTADSDEGPFHEPPREHVAERPSYTPPPAVYEPVHTYEDVQRIPWYRSTLFLFVTFFLMPPLWAMLIYTDPNQGCLAKLVAFTIIAASVAACIGVLGYSGLVTGPLQEWLQDINTSTLTTRTPVPAAASTPQEAPAAAPTSADSQPAAGTSVSCKVIWQEHEADDLVGRNRAMVWEEVVAEQVQGSGMTPREFYDLVVEHNPSLVTDGYEFKRGRQYLLPKCE